MDEKQSQQLDEQGYPIFKNVLFPSDVDTDYAAALIPPERELPGLDDD